MNRRPTRVRAQTCRSAIDEQRLYRTKNRARARRILAYLERETGRISTLRSLMLQVAAQRYSLAAGDLEENVASVQLMSLYRQARVVRQQQRLRAL